MTFEKLATMVANAIEIMVKENDYETFDEMKKAEWWSAEDIRDIISETIDELEINAYIDEQDKSSVILNYAYDMKYGQFKKLVMAELKK